MGIETKFKRVPPPPRTVDVPRPRPVVIPTRALPPASPAPEVSPAARAAAMVASRYSHQMNELQRAISQAEKEKNKPLSPEEMAEITNQLGGVSPVIGDDGELLNPDTSLSPIYEPRFLERVWFWLRSIHIRRN